MKKITTASLLAACGSLLFGACGGKGEPADPQIEEVVAAYCDLTYTCCDEGEAAFYVGPYVLPEDCTSRLMEAAAISTMTTLDLSAIAELRAGTLVIPNLPALNEAVQDGRVVISREGLDACKEYLSSKDCNQEPEPPPLGCQPAAPPPDEGPCGPASLFIGQLIEGQDCSSAGISFECAPGYRCGTVGGLGVDGRCVRLRQVTESCVMDADCGAGLYCSELDGTCKEFSDVGETCAYADRNDPAPTEETLLVKCAAGLSCNPLTELCVEACQEGAVCGESDAACDETADLSCILGRCSRLRELDQPCAVSDDCNEDLYCTLNLQAPGELSCQPTLSDDAPCVAGRDCDSGYCPTATGVCTEQVAIGDPCPTGTNDECVGSACVRETPSETCGDAGDCPESGVCMPDGRCGYHCIEKKDDGAHCDVDTECTSGSCAATFCRTLPVKRGVECDEAADCESLFCNYESPRQCADLPLGLNDPCTFGTECSTGVCFDGECKRGLEEGDHCGEIADLPCDPLTTRCDLTEDPPVCVIWRETGEECEAPEQCRSGSCTLAHGRLLCSPAAEVGEAVCDGGGPGIDGDGGAAGAGN